MWDNDIGDGKGANTMKIEFVVKQVKEDKLGKHNFFQFQMHWNWGNSKTQNVMFYFDVCLFFYEYF